MSVDPGADGSPELGPEIPYAEFGHRFLEYAASTDRIAAAFGALTGSSIDMGPMGVGPGRIAKVVANARLGEPILRRYLGEPITFDLAIPLHVILLLDLAVDRHRFDVDGTIHLQLTVRTAAPLRVLIDISEPHAGDVRINVTTATRRSQLLRILAGVDQEIRRFIARYIAREIRKPHIAALRDIDVASRLDAAWKV